MATASALLVPTAAHASTVALFNDPTYVDASPVVDDGIHEAFNVQASLESFGDAVTPFTDHTADGLHAALAGKDVLALPEQENRSLGPDLDADAQAAIRDYVSGGGTFLVFDDHSDTPILNSVFGFSLTRTSYADFWNLQPLPADSPFAGATPTLSYQSKTDYYDTSSLPAGSTSVYQSADGTSSAVFAIPYGKGTIVYLGWDWYDSTPPDDGTIDSDYDGQDGGWQDVLRRAADIAPPAAPVVVAPPAVTTTTTPSTTTTPAGPVDTTPPTVTKLRVTPHQVRFRLSEPATAQVLVSTRRVAHHDGRTIISYRRVRALQISKRYAGTASVRLNPGLKGNRFRVSITSRDRAGNAGKTRRLYRTF